MSVPSIKVPRRSVPHLRDDLQESILRFLAGYREIAEQAKNRCTADAIACVLHMDLSRNVEYWSDVVSAIDWLASRVSFRQSYLPILNPDGSDWKCQETKTNIPVGS